MDATHGSHPVRSASSADLLSLSLTLPPVSLILCPSLLLGPIHCARNTGRRLEILAVPRCNYYHTFSSMHNCLSVLKLHWYFLSLNDNVKNGCSCSIDDVFDHGSYNPFDHQSEENASCHYSEWENNFTPVCKPLNFIALFQGLMRKA